MIKLVAPVGRGQSNSAGDVALVQACLMMAKDKKKRAFYGGIANGIGGQSLWSALTRFLDEAGFGGTVLKPRSPELRALVTSIPGKYRFMRAVGKSSVLHIPERQTTFYDFKGPERENIPFPRGLQDALLKGLKTAWKASGLTISLVKKGLSEFDITDDGRFCAYVTVSGSRWVDPQSLALSEKLPRQLQTYVANAVARPSGLFSPKVSGETMAVVSKKAYPSLRKSLVEVFWQKYGPGPTKRGNGNASPVVARCRMAVSMIYYLQGAAGAPKLRQLAGCLDGEGGLDPAGASAVAQLLAIQKQCYDTYLRAIELMEARYVNRKAFKVFMNSGPVRVQILKMQADAREVLSPSIFRTISDIFLEQSLKAERTYPTAAGQAKSRAETAEAVLELFQYVKLRRELKGEEQKLEQNVAGFMALDEEYVREVNANLGRRVAVEAAYQLLWKQVGPDQKLPMLPMVERGEVWGILRNARELMADDPVARGMLARIRVGLRLDALHFRQENEQAMQPILTR